jgi:hypothetical protein
VIPLAKGGPYSKSLDLNREMIEIRIAEFPPQFKDLSILALEIR